MADETRAKTGFDLWAIVINLAGFGLAAGTVALIVAAIATG